MMPLQVCLGVWDAAGERDATCWPDLARLIQVNDDIDALARSIRIVPLTEEGLDPSFTPA